MRVAILSANLGNFDTPVDPVPQLFPEGVKQVVFHRFTDEDFPPVAGLTPRFQYRIPKLFGWQMFPDFDIYIWLDGVFSFTRDDCLQWFMQNLGDADMAFFKHPQRNTIKEEVDHIEQKLQEGSKYMIPRYKNGLHKEQMELINKDSEYTDDILYTSTAFIYRNNTYTQLALRAWWYLQSRYFTCDQVALPYALGNSLIKVNVLPGDQYHSDYLKEVSKHK